MKTLLNQNNQQVKLATAKLSQSLTGSQDSVKMLALLNKLPFATQDTNPTGRALLTIPKLYADVYEKGILEYSKTEGIPHASYHIQRNSNIELLFKFGNVKFLKVLCSFQYFEAAKLHVVVLRIHSETYPKFKDLITKLREAYELVDGNWRRKSLLNADAKAIENKEASENNES